MANGNPVEPEASAELRKSKPRKPCSKPAFRFELVFEAQALSCGKVGGISTMIHQSLHHRIVETLGAGCPGVVYKAEDARLHRFFALKYPP